MKFNHALIATGLGLGYIPIAPGTAGAVGALIIALAISYSVAYNILLAFLIIAVFFIGVNSSGKLTADWGRDPSKVVIDEVVGMWIALWMIPHGFAFMIVAFLMFRIFDIYKPLYIKEFEKLPGGWGIMMDDVVAGIYSNISVQILSVMISILWY
jgi:phosphatidylglycerophosphatase A